MFDKWKMTVAGLMIGVILGWAAWSFSRPETTPTTDIAQTNAVSNEIAAENAVANPNGMPNGVPNGVPNAASNLGQAMPNATAHLIGKPLPSWNFPKTAWANTWKPITTESLRGSVALVEIFRINCSHCQQTAPFMAAMQNNFMPKGLKIIGIQSPLARNPEENDWKKVQYVVGELWQLKYPMAFDAGSQYLQKLYQNDYDSMRWPTVLLLDRKGVVVYGHTGHREILEQQLYAEIMKQLAKK